MRKHLTTQIFLRYKTKECLIKKRMIQWNSFKCIILNKRYCKRKEKRSY